MSQSLTCRPCGHLITAETEDELVSAVIDHAQSEHGHELSRDHILAEVRGEDPEEVHKRGI
jgi:predicted small metal-binding protein